MPFVPDTPSTQQTTQNPNFLQSLAGFAKGAGAVAGNVGKALFNRTYETFRPENILGTGRKASPFTYVNRPFGEAIQEGLVGGVLNPAAGVAGEIAPWLMPVGAFGKGKGIIAGAARGGKFGATVGALRGATTPDASLLEQGKAAATQGAIGGVTGGVIGGVFGGVESALRSGKKIITQLFHPQETELAKFQRNTGMDFGDEILRREGRNIAGKNYKEIINHFQDRERQADQAVDQLLSKSGKTVDRNLLVNEVDKLVVKLRPQQWNIGTGTAISQLQGIKEDLLLNPQQLPLVTLNNIKRQLQGIAKGAYTIKGDSTIASEAVAGLADVVKTGIERLYQQVQDMNKVTQLYHLATRAIERQANAAGIKRSTDLLGKIVQSIPLGVLGFGVAGGNFPIAAGAGAMVAGSMARNALYSPQAQTGIAQGLQRAGQSFQAPVQQGIRNFLTKLGVTSATQLGGK